MLCTHQRSEPTKPPEVQNSSEKIKKKEKPKGQGAVGEVLKISFGSDHYSLSVLLMAY